MDLIQNSDMSFKDEILTELDSKIFPIQSYINYDNYIIIGHGSIVSFKNLSNVNECEWNHYVRHYKTVSENLYFRMHDKFSEDIHYFFMT